MNSLINIRNEIDKIDKELLSLFEKRMDCAKQVANIKLSTGDEIYKADREKALKESLLNEIKHEYYYEYEAFLSTILRVSRKYQYGIVCPEKPMVYPQNTVETDVENIYYQGTKGSYSYEAAKHIFGDGNFIAKNFFDEVFSCVEHPSDRAVIPFENSYAGVVSDAKNLLCHKDLYINVVYNKKIHHCLCGKEMPDLKKDVYVHSHIQALSQCKNYIKEHNLIPVSEINTAIAAKNVSEYDSNHVVICSKSAADEYSLNILHKNINDSEDNITRFAVLSSVLDIKEEDTHTAIVFSTSHRSGALSFALSLFSDFGVNLTTLHSEPSQDTPWEYLFFAEFEGNAQSLSIRTLLYQLSKELSYIKILGSYRVISD